MARTPPQNGAERDGVAAETDRVLLTRFVRHRDEAAFTEIVRRHSDLVFGVCLRTLRDRQAAEDAFQATFLVLARSARKIRRRTSLGSWLHGVACRVSLRSLAKRHRRRETCSPMNTITTEPTLQDVGEIYEQQLLDAELQELPQKYREPLVLHYLQGLSNQQVADRLDVSVSCVEGRLKRGKKELRLRLTRRGIELGAALTAVHLTTAAAKAGALESLITTTAHVAASNTFTSSTAAAVPSEAASQLAAKEIAMLTSTKTSVLVSLAATVAVVAGLAGATSSASPGNVGTDTVTSTSSSHGTLFPEDTLVLAQGGQNSQDDAADVAEIETGLEKLWNQAEEVFGSMADLSAEGDEERIGVLEVQVADMREQAETLAELTEALRESSSGDLSRAESMLQEVNARLTKLERTIAAGMEQTFPDLKRRDLRTASIEGTLNIGTTIEFPGNPLRDVLDYISDVHNIPITLDETNLEEAGISPDEEVSLVISGVTLRNVLEIMLKDISGVELDYIVENQVLKITTREHADSVMETRVYSLNQLPAEYSPEDIARVIIRTIAPETWRNSVVTSADEEMMSDLYGAGLGAPMEAVAPVGGSGHGSVEPLPGVLVVTQSQRVHRQIVDLLSQLKRQYEVTGAARGFGASGYSGEEFEDYGTDVGGEFEGGADEFGDYGEEDF